MSTNETTPATGAAVTALAEDIVRDIKERLATEADSGIEAANILPEMSLRDDLDMDSMQAVSLSLDLEDALSITLDEEDLVEMQTVGDLLAIVEKKLSQLPKA
ncbi:MAG: acyl carrier protein [Pseudomonadota bacterium]